MKKSSNELTALIIVLLILIFGIGVALGFSIGAQFPKTNWAEFAGTIAQVIATIGTISGAYWLATLQKRNARFEHKERLIYLIEGIVFQISESLDYAPSFKPFTLVEDAQIGLSNLEKVPIEHLPSCSLTTRDFFIEQAREAIEQIRDWEKTWEKDQVDRSSLIAAMKKRHIQGYGERFLEEIHSW
ncbi:hypothetical protein [Terasakiella pusilla]|uniref:hypothetical protein n=1 Tax=Terasakiella pusilla TaxID=64973 RepID=UPI003AA98114